MKPWERLLGKTDINSHSLIKINLEFIDPSPYQPRVEFDELELRDLAKSIQEVGMIQPIIVRKDKDRYQLVAGERRLRASKIAGLLDITAVVVDMSDGQVAAASLIENIQRKDLNYFEEANAYALLIGEFGLTQDEVAGRVGRSQSAVANKLRLLKLSDNVKSSITPNVITERHARALLKLDDEEEQMLLLNMIYENELSVKQTEEYIDNLKKDISREINTKKKTQKLTFIIRDARIFLNTIRDTVHRAQETGINMAISEIDSEEELQITITIPKVKRGEAK